MTKPPKAVEIVNRRFTIPKMHSSLRRTKILPRFGCSRTKEIPRLCAARSGVKSPCCSIRSSTSSSSSGKSSIVAGSTLTSAKSALLPGFAVAKAWWLEEWVAMTPTYLSESCSLGSFFYKNTFSRQWRVDKWQKFPRLPAHLSVQSWLPARIVNHHYRLSPWNVLFNLPSAPANVNTDSAPAWALKQAVTRFVVVVRRAVSASFQKVPRSTSSVTSSSTRRLLNDVYLVSSFHTCYSFSDVRTLIPLPNHFNDGHPLRWPFLRLAEIHTHPMISHASL